MAELLAAGNALGVASSLITFGDVAWRVLKRLKEYCDRTKDVPEVIKHMIPQLELLANKLEESRNIRQADGGPLVPTNSHASLSDFLLQFKKEIESLDRLTTKMLPNKADSTGLRIKKAGLSFYYEKELSKIWDRLETYKSTFIMQYTNGASHPAFIPQPTAPKTHYHYPTSVVSHLVTREIPLSQIEDAFSDPAATVSPRVLVLLGLGGCGKTQLALQYCQQSEAKRWISSIFWVDASSPTAVAQSYTKIAGIVTDDAADPDNFEANITTVKGRLGTWADRWLLVFDNFDDPTAFNSRDIRDYFPQGGNGAILFTSRHGDAKRLGRYIRIDEMLESEGLELLFRQAGCERNESNSMIGKDIIARLGNLALAIDQAGAYISARCLPLHLFMDHYDKRREKVLKEIPATLWEYRRKLKDAERETSLSVFTTWEMSFEQLNRNTAIGRTQMHLMSLSAFFNNEDIFEDLFKTYWESVTPEWMRSLSSEGSWDSFEFQDLVAQLAKLSLISSLQMTATGARFSLHPLVQDWIKLSLDPEDRRSKVAEAIAIISHYIDDQDVAGMPMNMKEILLSHVTAAVHNETIFLNSYDGFESPALMDAAHCFGIFYRKQGRLKEAELMYDQALAGKENALGPDHPSTLSTVHHLAGYHKNQGRLLSAEALYDRALAGREKELGLDHSSTLSTVNNLALLYKDQGRLVEAEALYNRALTGTEKALGPDHSLTLSAVDNMATLYMIRGRLAEAEALYNRALTGREKALGPDHSLTLGTKNNLAILYTDQGRLVEAEALYNRALTGREKALGPDHSSTLDTVNNLAILYKDQGRLAEAEALYERALAGREKALGPDHSSTLNTVNNLAILYQDQGRLAEAEALYDRALAGKEKALGLDHPSTLSTVHNMAGLYKSQGRLVSAEALYDRALTGREKVLGPDHPSTLDTVNNIALLYEHQGRVAEAETLYNRVLAGTEKALRLDHPSTLDTVNNLAILYQDQGRLMEAEALYVRALAGMEKALGQDHASTLSTVHILGKFYANQGRLAEAEALYDRALVGREKVLGPDHASTLSTISQLADLYRTQGRLAEMEAILARLQLGR